MGSALLRGPQRGKYAARESKRSDGCWEVLLDGPQRGKDSKMTRRGKRVHKDKQR